MSSILVTGGAGFIGGGFVRRLLRETDLTVINLDCLTYAGNLDSLVEALENPRHIFVRGDISDGPLVRQLLAEHRPRGLVHFAAESHVDRSIGAPTPFLQTNVLGTFHLLEAALAYWQNLASEERDQFRFLHISTDEVYGSLPPSGKFTETTPYAPNSPYSASKAASDHFVRAYLHTYGLPVLTTNCSNNYGPYQFPEKLIPLMVLNALEGKRLPVYGDGQNVRDWLHVQDHCVALQTVLERGRIGETYNIGGDSERTNLDVVRAICSAVDELRPDLPHRPTINLVQYVADRPGHDRRYAIDAGKIKRELGWQPTIVFERGILDTVRWYLDHPEWVQRVGSGEYRRERLGLRSAAPTPATTSSATAMNAGKRSANSASTDTSIKYKPGAIHDVEFKPLKPFEDQRGWLVEIYREDELPDPFHPVMSYVSQTQPGVARGPHEHADQADYFAFLGPGDFAVYLWDARRDSPTFGNSLRYVAGESNPRAVTVPAGVVHAYKNVSQHAGWVFNAPNRLYAGCGKRDPVDEVRHEDRAGAPFALGEEPAKP